MALETFVFNHKSETVPQEHSEIKSPGYFCLHGSFICFYGERIGRAAMKAFSLI